VRDTETNSQKLPKLAIAAAIVSLLFAVSGLLAAIRQPVLILSALVPTIAAIAILRRRVWGAYGFALFELCQALLIPFPFFSEAQVHDRIALLIAFGVALAVSVLFFFAGRSLASSGAARGLVWPWIAVACLFSLPLFFLRAYSVPTGTMEDTLLIGDRILVRVFPRVTPARGDIVVFHYPVDRKQIFVKRVIGVGGDRIRMVSRVVYRNGVKLNEPYAMQRFPPDPSRDNAPSDPAKLRYLPDAIAARARDMFEHHVQNGEIVVPPGEYFVLGDNRDNSLDSRYWGFINRSDLIGKPLFIYESEETTPDGKTHERWSRIFKIIR
jgi:signal peptidase I